MITQQNKSHEKSGKLLSYEIKSQVQITKFVNFDLSKKNLSQYHKKMSHDNNNNNNIVQGVIATNEAQIPSLALFPLEEALDDAIPLLYNFSTATIVNTLNDSSNISSSSLNNTANEYIIYQNCPTNGDSIGHLVNFLLYVLVCIIGLLGNTLVIYVVLRYSKMQTITNVYILHLAVADECFLIGIPFLLHTIIVGNWQFGSFMCKAYMVSTSITQFTSSIFLLIMSADRYLAVCHPISSTSYRTPQRSKIISAMAWLTSAILMLPVIIFADTVQLDEHISCHIKWPEMAHHETGFTFIMYVFTLGFATPLIFILCFYSLVIRKLRTVGPQNKSKEKKRSHRKVTRLVLTVITVYILCWLPFWISQLILITSTPAQECVTRLEIAIFLLVGCLGYSNSAMNPFLYAFLSENFKKSFHKAFATITATYTKVTTTASGTGGGGGETPAIAEMQSKDANMFRKLSKKGRKLTGKRQNHQTKQQQKRQQQRHKQARLGVDSNTTTTTMGTNATNGTTTTTTTATTMTLAETSEILPTEIINSNPHTHTQSQDNCTSIGGVGDQAIENNLNALGIETIANTSNMLKANGVANVCGGEMNDAQRPPVLYTDL